MERPERANIDAPFHSGVFLFWAPLRGAPTHKGSLLWPRFELSQLRAQWSITELSHVIPKPVTYDTGWTESHLKWSSRNKKTICISFAQAAYAVCPSSDIKATKPIFHYSDLDLKLKFNRNKNQFTVVDTELIIIDQKSSKCTCNNFYPNIRWCDDTRSTRI